MDPVRLNSINELAGGARLGGNFGGANDISQTLALWKGRPPILPGDNSLWAGPMTIAITATPPPADPGRTVTIQAEGANAWGGKTTRVFSLGAGLSAELRMGNFQHVNIRAMQAADKVTLPADMMLYFSWSYDLLGRTPLHHYLPVLAATPTLLPEATEFITPELACTITWLLPTFGATVSRSVAAGEQVPADWGAFSCNIANTFLLQLRGL